MKTSQLAWRGNRCCSYNGGSSCTPNFGGVASPAAGPLGLSLIAACDWVSLYSATPAVASPTGGEPRRTSTPRTPHVVV